MENGKRRSLTLGQKDNQVVSTWAHVWEPTAYRTSS